MKTTLTQGLVTVAVFFGAWFALSRINWVGIFEIQHVTDKTEQKLGDFFWKVFKQADEEINNTQVINAVDSIVAQVCKANNIDKNSIKVHILRKDDVNAFALPNGHLIIYTGLILNTDRQEELSGVICHEIAHIELKHVMKKLVKEMGFSVLVSMTTGNGSAEVAKEAAKVLSSSAFDRSLEKDADIKAIEYLENAHIDPQPFADFLYKLSDNEPDYLVWLSTHPELKERATYIIENSKKGARRYKPVLAGETWEKTKEALEN